MRKVRSIFKYLFVIGMILLLYAAAVEPYTLKTTEYTLENQSLSGVKIVFAADFHIAPYVWEKQRLRRIVAKINAQNADLVVLGGDYVNRHKQNSTLPPQDIVAALAEISASKVAVLGNHDSYYGKNEVMRVFTEAGIPVLDNQNISMIVNNRKITIAGVADYYTDKPDIGKALADVASPVVFVTHSPDIFPQLRGRAAVAFAGHTHGGQIVLPLFGAPLVPSDYGQRYRYGLIYEQNTPLIVSSGLGTSLLPLRFNNRPEIVFVEFK